MAGDVVSFDEAYAPASGAALSFDEAYKAPNGAISFRDAYQAKPGLLSDVSQVWGGDLKEMLAAMRRRQHEGIQTFKASSSGLFNQGPISQMAGAAFPGTENIGQIADTGLNLGGMLGGVITASGVGALPGAVAEVLSKRTPLNRYPGGAQDFGNFVDMAVQTGLLGPHQEGAKAKLPDSIVYNGATFKTAKARAAQEPGPTPEIIPDPAAGVPEAVPAPMAPVAPETPITEPVSPGPEISPVEAPEAIPATPVAEPIVPAPVAKAPRVRKPAVLRDESITEPISFEEAWTPPEELAAKTQPEEPHVGNLGNQVLGDVTGTILNTPSHPENGSVMVRMQPSEVAQLRAAGIVVDDNGTLPLESVVKLMDERAKRANAWKPEAGGEPDPNVLAANLENRAMIHDREVAQLTAAGEEEAAAAAAQKAAELRTRVEELKAQQGALRQQPKFVPIEAPDILNIEPLEKGLYDLAGDLNKTLGITHRQGGFKGANTLGIYRPGTGVVRTRQMHELDTLSHEGGHHLEYLELPELSKVLNAHAKTLEPMAYPGADPRALRQEGFAEFFRWYVTNPAVAMKENPGFYKDFEAALAVDRPDILEKLREVQAHSDALYKAPSAAVAMQDVVPATPKGPFTKMMEGLQENPRRWTANFANEVYTGIVDRFNPINRAQKDLLEIAHKRTGKKVNREAYQDAYKIARSAPGARDAGHMDITDGVYGYHSVTPDTLPLSEGVRMALETPDRGGVGGNGGPPMRGPRLSQKELDLRYHQFGSYLNARNMRAQWQRYWEGGREKPPTNIPASVYDQAIKTFEAANPHWDRAANIVYDWNTALWRKRLDYGFITKKQYADGIEQHPDYVPAQRDMSDPGMDPDLISMGKAGGDTGKHAGGVKQMRGSSRRVVDPIWTMAQQAYELNMLIARNESVGALVEAMKIAGRGGAAIMEEVPTSKIKAIDVNIQEALQNAMKERQHSISERDELELEQAAEMISDIMGEDASTKIYRAGDRTDDQAFLHWWSKGRRHTYELAGGQYGKQLYSAFADMNRPMQSTAINLMAWPARILRLGVVTNPRFAVRNVMGDQPAAAVFNKGYIPFYDWAKGIKEDVTAGEHAKRHSVARGAIGGMQTAAERQVLHRKSLKVLQGKGFKVTDLPDHFTRLSELGETGTRLGIFMRESKNAEARGLSPWEADQEGSYAARDVLDFDRRGAYEFTQGLTRVIPFLNANIQGVDKSIRVQFPAVLMRYLRGEKPSTPMEQKQLTQAQWAWMGVGLMAAGSVALEAYNEQTHGEAWKEVPDWLKQNNWVFFKPGTDREVFVWKKPYELGSYGNALARVYEALATGDKTAYVKSMKEFAGMFLPAAVEPPILGIPFHLASNKDQFGQPIVSPGVEDLEPRDQFNDYTSGTAIKMGELMSMSPAQLDYVMHGLGGYWGKDVLKGVDQLTGRHAPTEAGLPDMFFVDSFVRDASRGSNASKEFFDTNDKLAQTQASINRMITEGRIDEAAERMKELTPEQKGWVLLNTFGHGKEKQAHPLVYSQKYYGVVSQLTKDVEAGDVRPTPTGERIKLTPTDRREVVDALHHLNMAQLHEALRGMKVEGWANQGEISIPDALAELEKASPGVRQALTSREHAAELMPLKSSQQLWAGVRNRYENMDEAAFKRAAEAKMRGGRGGATRLLRERETE